MSLSLLRRYCDQLSAQHVGTSRANKVLTCEGVINKCHFEAYNNRAPGGQLVQVTYAQLSRDGAGCCESIGK